MDSRDGRRNLAMTEPGFNSSIISNEYSQEFASSMHYMERPYRPPKEKFPKVAVPNTSIGVSGLTFSIESSDKAQTEDGRLEFEALKCILNREAFINRCIFDLKVVNKRFKTEIADLLDCIRTATIDVIDAIVRWRECKNDHDAAFMWNGMNYILKMPSDLDILDSYLAVKKWAGYSFIRNPLAVPFPLEHGLPIFAERILDPGHLDIKLKVDGHRYIGGLTHATLRNKYTPKSMMKTIDPYLEKRKKKKGLPNPLAADDKKGKSEEEKVNALDYKVHGKDMTYIQSAKEFGLNDDMSLVRQVELVILKEEEKFGKFSREPEGRIAPILQAYTRFAALELCKDDHRTLEEPSSSEEFAPHGANSDVGIVEVAWKPDKTLINSLLNSELLHKTDKSLTALIRGEAKIGGALAPINFKSEKSRIRKPCRISLPSEAEFSRTTLRKTLSDKLNAIQEISTTIEKLKYYIIGLDESGNGNISPSKSDNIIDDVDKRIEKIKRQANRAASSLGEVSESKSDYATLTVLTSESVDGIDINSASSPARSVKSQATPKKGAGAKAKIRKPKEQDKVEDKKNLNIEKIISKLAELQVLEEELAKLGNKQYYIDGLDRLRREDILTKAYKSQERILNNREKSRDIERRRRLLTPEEGERKGPPPQEPSNIYDYYAIRIQRMIRGFVGRCYAKWFRAVNVNAAIKAQKIIRGWLARMFCKRKILYYNSVTNIIKVYRGWKARGTSAAMVKQKGYITSTLKIQCVWRGYLGKCRAILKRNLDQAAANAITLVDPKAIDIEDVRVLGRRILNAIEEPGVTTFPPPQVLALLSMCSIIINSARGPMGISSYDFINDRTFKDIKTEDMDWFAAAQLLNRAERFMRVIRALAFGPAAKPPRILLIPTECINIFISKKLDPDWNLSVFENMGMGSRFATQLFKWANSIVEVAEKQQIFMTFLASNFPPWLPDMARLQAKLRKLDLDISIHKTCMSQIEQNVDKVYDPSVRAFLVKDLKLLHDELHQFKLAFKATQNECNKIRKDQSSREKYSKVTFDGKIKLVKSDYDNMLKEYNEISALANQGDAAALAKLKDVRDQYTKAKLVFNEMEAQYKLLVLQCEKNEERRKEEGKLPVELLDKSIAVGQLKYLNHLSCAVTKSILINAGVKREKDLRNEKLVMFKKSEQEDARTKFEFRKLYYEVENEKLRLDNEIMDKIKELELADIKGKDQMIPSDKDLQEERMEDELQSVREREKKLQFIADRLLQPFVRKQPWLVCLSRDLPSSAKRRIQDDLMQNMPGVFQVLNFERNMGFDVKAIQAILNDGKSVILSVDAGLTKMTRANFVYNLEMCCKCLVPISPYVCIAMGDESNKRTASYSEHFGVAKPDIQVSNDGNIKSCLESLSWVMDELEGKPKYYAALQQTAMDLVPPSPSFALVVEALYILQSEETQFFVAPGVQDPDTWKMTHVILADPSKLFSRMRSMKRGCGEFAMLECLRQYMMHKSWPKYGSRERNAFPVLHLLAYLIETWVLCENLTKLGGGVPPSFNIDACPQYLRTVIYVSDTYDSDDLINSSKEIISLYGWRSASFRIQRAILVDMQVSKITRKFNGVLHTITAYRENSMIYFDAYNPVTTEMYWASIRANEVASIICPNFTKRAASDVAAEGPQDLPDLHRRLINQLNLEKFSSHNLAKLMLKCKRSDSFLKSTKIIIDGHFVFLTVYEAALGELAFSVSIPEFTAFATCTLPLHKRLPLFHQASTDKERAIFHDDDARPMVDFIIDRLMIHPSRALVNCTGIDDIMKGEFKDRFLPPSLQVAQGFKLKIRYHGGYGKLILRQVVRFNNVQHILSLFRCSKDNSLRVVVYDPIEQYQMETVVTEYLRRCFFGSTITAPRTWIKEFLARLKYNWRGKHHSIIFDNVVLTRGYSLPIIVDKKGEAVLAAAAAAAAAKIEAEKLALQGGEEEKLVSNGVNKSVLSTTNKKIASPSGKPVPGNAKLLNASPPRGGGAAGKNSKTTKGKQPEKKKSDKQMKGEDRPVKRRYIAHLKVIDDQKTEFAMYDPINTKTYTCDLSREDLCRLQQKFRIDRGEIQLPSQTKEASGKTSKSAKKQKSIPNPDIDPNSEPNATALNNFDDENVSKPPEESESEVLSDPVSDSKPDMETPIDASSEVKPDGELLDESEKVAKDEEDDSEDAEVKGEIEKAAAEDSGDDDATVNSTTSMTSEQLNFYNYDIPFYQLLPSFADRELFLSHLVRSVEIVRCGEEYSFKIMGSDLKDLKENEIYSSAEKKSEIPYDTSLKLKSTLPVRPKTDDINEVISYNRQLPYHRISDFYDSLKQEAEAKALAVIERDADAASELELKLSQNMGSLYQSEEELDILIKDTSRDVLNDLLDSIFETTIRRFEERNEPGIRQELHFLEIENQKLIESEIYVPEKDYRLEYGIVGREEKLVYEENNIRTTYREGMARWFGTVNIKVYEQFCWVGENGDGCGRKLRFVVYEPECKQYFEGYINNSVHLKDILGMYGQDLLPQSHTSEMLIYITKFRLELCKNLNRENDVDPLYTLNFQNDSIYDGKSAEEKAEESDLAKMKARTKNKLKDLEKSRGRKIMRMSRRVSGVLLYLTVFELPIQKEETPNDAPKPENEGDIGENNSTTIVQAEGTNEIEGNTGVDESKSPDISPDVGLPPIDDVPPEREEYTCPSFRIIGYDARTKRKTVTIASPEAITEVAGGPNSPWLAYNKREDLAKLVCNSLVIYHIPDHEPEVCVPWFGSALTQKETVDFRETIILTWKPKFVKTRPGKLYSERLLVGKLECIVSFYANRSTTILEDGTTEQELGVIANVYCAASAIAPDLNITQAEQTARLGKPLMQFPEGNIRDTTCRRLAQFLNAQIVYDPDDGKTKLLQIGLNKPKFDFITKYNLVRHFRPGEYSERPVGYPTVFMPLDTCGFCIARLGMTLENRNLNFPPADCIVSIFTKQKSNGPERGLVVKLFERASSHTGTLHLAPSELMALCERAGKPGLLQKIVDAKNDADSEILDAFEQEFEALTVKGEKLNKYRGIVAELCDVVIKDLGVWDTPEMSFVPYLKSKSAGLTLPFS